MEEQGESPGDMERFHVYPIGTLIDGPDIESSTVREWFLGAKSFSSSSLLKAISAQPQRHVTRAASRGSRATHTVFADDFQADEQSHNYSLDAATNPNVIE